MFSFFHYPLISLLLISLTIHPTFQTNQCPGRCYSTTDSSAQGYYCSSIFHLLHTISYLFLSSLCHWLCFMRFCNLLLLVPWWLVWFWLTLCPRKYTWFDHIFILLTHYLVCPTGCSACNAQKECFQCQTNYKLSGTSCVQTCPGKTFFQDTPTSQPCQLPECIGKFLIYLIYKPSSIKRLPISLFWMWKCQWMQSVW